MAKAPIVSKKQLEASGYTTLRDYLNHQRGLTRKGVMTVGRPNPIPSDKDAPNEITREASRGVVDKAFDDNQRDSAALAKSNQLMREINRGQTDRDSAALAVDNEKKRETKRSAPPVPLKNSLSEDESSMKRGGKVKKMASGGSASGRADGIAQRGKTRGKMC